MASFKVAFSSKNILLIFLMICSHFIYASNSNAEEPYLYSVMPKEGEGINSFLSRYYLLNESCNKEAFYDINNLNSSSSLIKHKAYKLPIYIYQYDGHSIRSTINDMDMKKALRIQLYNRKLVKNNKRQSTYELSRILWVPYHEINCQNNISRNTSDLNNITTKSKKTLSVSLFGKDDKVEIKSNSLNNEVYYLVSGHGGPDPGAIALNINHQHDLCEDEYAYDVTLRLAKKLMENGALVHIIIQDKNDGIREEEYLDCDKDETCMGDKIPLSQIKRLKQRTTAVNKLYNQHRKKGISKQKLICIHVDSRSIHTNQDVFFYYYKKSRTGKSMAQNLHTTFRKKYELYQKSRGYHGTVNERPLYVLRNTTPPAVYVELANIKNRKDRLRLIKSSNRQALANWLYEGLIK